MKGKNHGSIHSAVSPGSVLPKPLVATKERTMRPVVVSLEKQYIISSKKEKHVMDTRTIVQRTVGKCITFLAAVILVSSLVYGQGNLILRDGVSYSGTGTLNVKKDIDNSNTSAPVSIGGTVNLTGTATTQNVGNVLESSISFSTLNAQGSQPKQLNVTVTVASALAVDNAITVDVTDQTLSIGGTSVLTGTGTLDVDNASSVVNFTRNDGTPQTVLGLTYAGTLGVSGSSAKDLGATTSAVTLTQAGGSGALTVDEDLSVSGTGTFATIADITGTSSLSFGATANGSITAITTITTGGVLTNSSSNLITVATLSDNDGSITAVGAGGLTFTTATNGGGTIEAQAGTLTFTNLSGNGGTIQTVGAGGLSFTNAAANSGTIDGSGGSGAVSFGSTLSQTGGAVTAGTGNASFASTVTNDATSSVTAGTGTSLDFNGNIDNSGTIDLTGTGSATMAGNFITSGTLTLAAGSNWTYDGASQDMATATYGHLNTAGSGTKTALGTITVAGNFDNGGSGDLAITTDMDEETLDVTGTRDNTNGTLRFGGLTNGLSFGTIAASAGTVIYDGAVAAVASQTIAAGSYYFLQFQGDAPKNVTTNTTVSTGNDVTLAANVTLNINETGVDVTTFDIGTSGLGDADLILQASSALVNQGTLNISGDLDLTGALTNDGTVTVGWLEGKRV